MAVASRSLGKPKHRPRKTTQRDGGMVRSGKRVLGMESVRSKFYSMGPWKTFVCYPVFFFSKKLTVSIAAGAGKSILWLVEH